MEWQKRGFERPEQNPADNECKKCKKKKKKNKKKRRKKVKRKREDLKEAAGYRLLLWCPLLLCCPFHAVFSFLFFRIKASSQVSVCLFPLPFDCTSCCWSSSYTSCKRHSFSLSLPSVIGLLLIPWLPTAPESLYCSPWPLIILLLYYLSIHSFLIHECKRKDSDKDSEEEEASDGLLFSRRIISSWEEDLSFFLSFHCSIHLLTRFVSQTWVVNCLALEFLWFQ